MLHKISVTRLGDLLHFGQIFKASGNNYFAQTAHILGKFCRGIKIFHFSSGIIFGQLLLTFGDFLLVTLHKILFDKEASIRCNPILISFDNW